MTNSPSASELAANDCENVTLPLPFVVTSVKPRNRSARGVPSPLAAAEAKNSTRNVSFATEFSDPRATGVLPEIVASVRTGRFCRPLTPASASPASFALTPAGALGSVVEKRSIAPPEVRPMVLRLIRTADGVPLPSSRTVTAEPSVWANRFPRPPSPPTVTSDVSPVTSTP